MSTFVDQRLHCRHILERLYKTEHGSTKQSTTLRSRAQVYETEHHSTNHRVATHQILALHFSISSSRRSSRMPCVARHLFTSRRRPNWWASFCLRRAAFHCLRSYSIPHSKIQNTEASSEFQPGMRHLKLDAPYFWWCFGFA